MMFRKTKNYLIAALLVCGLCGVLVSAETASDEVQTIKTEFETISSNVSKNEACSGGAMGLEIVSGESAELDITLNAPVEGKYLFEFSGNPPTTAASYESSYSIVQNSQELLLTRKTKEYYYDIYEAEIWLEKGESTLTIQISKRGMDNNCVLFGDYYQITLLEDVTQPVKTEFETISTSVMTGATYSGGAMGLFVFAGEKAELEITLTAPVDGKYLFEFSGNPPTTAASYESPYSIVQNCETLSLTRKTKEYYFDIYEAEVWLQKGENTLTIQISKRGMDDNCVLYGDYYQITLLRKAKNFIVEAENYTSRTFTPSKRTAMGELSNDQMIVYSGNLSSKVCFLEYVFDVEKAGWYELVSRNSVFNEPWTSDFMINVNGGSKYEPGKYSKPLRTHTEYSVDPNLIKDYKVGNFYLNEGSNKMRIYLDEEDPTQSGVYTIFVDCFKFTEQEFKFDKIVTNDDCGVYEQGNDVTVEIRHTASAEVQKEYTYKVTDFYGNVTEGNATLNVGESSVNLNFGAMECGWYRFELFENDEKVDFVNFTVVKPYADRYVGETPFAVDFGSNLLRNRDEIERQVRAAKLAGVKWMRERYSWKGLQYNKGNSIYYGDINKSVNMMHNNGIQVSTILYDLPDWTSEEELFDIYNFQKNAAENTDVDLWEILNETDGGNGSPADVYSAFYKAAALGNAAANTPAKTSMASQCISPNSFYNRLFMKNDLMYFSDIYNYHRHENLSESKMTKINTFNISEHISAAKQNGDRPFWITEAGTYMQVDSNNQINDNQRARQAQYCVTSTVESLAAGTEKHFWFIWPHYIENGKELGSFDEDLNPNPVYQAYATMTHMLGKGEYKGRLNIDGVYGYIFNDGISNIAVVWADSNKNISLSSASDVEVTDIMGKVTVIESNNDAVNVSVGEYPIYIPFAGISESYTSETFDRSNKDVPEFTTADKIVIQQSFEGQNASDSRMGYRINYNETANMTVKLYNFNNEEKKVRLFGSLYGYSVVPESSEVTIPAMDSVSVNIALNPSGRTLSGEQLNLAFNCEVDERISSPSVSYVIVEGEEIVPIELVDGSDNASKWSESSGGTMTITNTADGVHFYVEFADDSRWAYPMIKANGNIIKNYDGISFMARADADSINGGYYNINCYLADGTVYNLGLITGYRLKNDWIYVKATWDEFELYQNPQGHPEDTKLDPSKITYLKFGGNFYQSSVGYTLKNFGYIKADGEGIDILSACAGSEIVKIQATNNKRDFGEYDLIVAIYDEEGKVIQVKQQIVENMEPIKTYDINIKTGSTGGKIRLFAWDGVNGLKPINDAITIN